MRTSKRLQLFLREQKPETSVSRELKEIDRILSKADGINDVYSQILTDLRGGKRATGAEGMSAEQIVKLGILRTRSGASYRYLSEQTEDSLSVREFLNLGFSQKLSSSGIQSNLKRVKESTWKMLNECIKKYAEQAGVEDGKKTRTDTTTTETNIHYPTDASLLVDCIRVVTRVLNRAQAWLCVELESCDHYRSAKKKLYKINNLRHARRKQDSYLELIRLARKTVSYAEAALPVIAAHKCGDLRQMLLQNSLEADLTRYIPLSKQCIEQAYRRIVKKEKVPAAEKIFSIFEEETDIIEKGKRKIVFGHKILLTTGKSSLVLNLSVLDGNPADSTLVQPTIEQHQSFYGQAPEQMAFDGGFASANNRDLAKIKKVKELTFSKNLKMALDTLVSDKKIHRALMCFRAGIEGCISYLKRCFGLTRILDRTKTTFSAVAQCAVAAYNLTLLARIQIHKTTS